MKLKEEMDKAVEQGLEFIPPYKIADMAKTANKITQILADKAMPISYGYSEMRIILRMVENTLAEGIREKEESLCQKLT